MCRLKGNACQYCYFPFEDDCDGVSNNWGDLLSSAQLLNMIDQHPSSPIPMWSSEECSSLFCVDTICLVAALHVQVSFCHCRSSFACDLFHDEFGIGIDHVIAEDVLQSASRNPCCFRRLGPVYPSNIRPPAELGHAETFTFGGVPGWAVITQCNNGVTLGVVQIVITAVGWYLYRTC